MVPQLVTAPALLAPHVTIHRGHHRYRDCDDTAAHCPRSVWGGAVVAVVAATAFLLLALLLLPMLPLVLVSLPFLLVGCGLACLCMRWPSINIQAPSLAALSQLRLRSTTPVANSNGIAVSAEQGIVVVSVTAKCHLAVYKLGKG